MKKNFLVISVLIFFLLVSFVSASTPVKETTIDGDYPWIRVNSIGEHYVGEQFTISGTTNLPVDDNLIFEISSSYSPDAPTNTGEYSGLAKVIKVVKGEPYNEWSVDIDTSSFKPDEYIVNVESIETTSTATTSFDLLEKGMATATKTSIQTVMATKTATSTKTTTPVVTTEATTIPSTPTPTAAAPGFGVLVSLIALGTAAALLTKKE
jgi:trimeric autotransporter adhesin